MLYYTDYESNTTDLKIEFYGFEDCKPHQSYGLETRDLFILHFIQKGKGYFHYNGEKHQLNKGDFFLLLPGLETFYQADGQDPWSYFWIGLSGNKITHYLQQSTLFTEAVLINLSTEVIQQFDTKFSNIIDLMGLNNFDIYHHLSLFEKTYSLLKLLLSVSTRQDFTKLTQKKTYTLQLKNYLDSNYSQDVSIVDIAEKMALNRSYLSRIFKEEYNISPKNYLINLRIEKAKQLLVDTNSSISNISEAVGYKDVLTFSSAFKTQTQLSPTTYRTSHRASNNIIIKRDN